MGNSEIRILFISILRSRPLGSRVSAVASRIHLLAVAVNLACLSVSLPLCYGLGIYSLSRQPPCISLFP